MLVFLKDIELQDVKHFLSKSFPSQNIEIAIKDSDVSENRSEVFSKLRRNRRDIHVLCVYDFKYLKWSFIYCWFIFFSSKKFAYIQEASGALHRITLFKIFYWASLTLVSMALQIFDVLTYKLSLSTALKESSNNPIIDYNLKSKVAYIRATDTFNLRGGGSLGHSIGIVSAFEAYGSPVTFFGIDSLKGLRASDTIIIPPSGLYHFINLFGRFSYNKRMISKVAKIISNGDYKFIYQRASRDNYAGVALSKLFDIPLVLEFNSFLLWELEGSNHWIHRIFTNPTTEIEDFNLTHADIILVVSSALKNQLVDSGYDPSKILVAPNGVDVNRFSPEIHSSIQRRNIGIPQDKCVYGFSGTFGFWHGIDTLVNSIIEVVKERDDICFLLIGDGPGRASAQEALADYRNVIFTGLISYDLVPQYLNLCDVLLSPHQVPEGERFIGSPTKLYEYMACGKIIIGSNLDQISDAMSPSIGVFKVGNDFMMTERNDTQVGIVVPPGCIKALSYAINTVADDMESFLFLGGNAREKAIQMHGWESVVSTVEERVSVIAKSKKIKNQKDRNSKRVSEC